MIKVDDNREINEQNARSVLSVARRIASSCCFNSFVILFIILPQKRDNETGKTRSNRKWQSVLVQFHFAFCQFLCQLEKHWTIVGRLVPPWRVFE
jgi:hypothetical protein